MILYIDTTKEKSIKVMVKKDSRIVAQKKIVARHTQSEKLLPLVDKILKEKKLKLSDIRKVQINNDGGSFTALRIGVATANALGYALGVPVEEEVVKGFGRLKEVKRGYKKFDIAEPIYDKEPNITVKKCLYN